MPPVLVGFVGRVEDSSGAVLGMKGAGKDTLASMIATHVRQEYPEYYVTTLGFADSLKDAVSHCFNLPRKLYDTPEMKEQPLPAYPGWTYRRLLEVFGTEICRAIDTEMWIELLSDKIRDQVMDDMGGHLKYYTSAVGDRLRNNPTILPPRIAPNRLIQVTDVRFKNEYDRLKQMGAVIVQVRRRLGPAVEYRASGHASDQVDPSMVPDLVVENSGSLLDLAAQIPRVWADILRAQVKDA